MAAIRLGNVRFRTRLIKRHLAERATAGSSLVGKPGETPWSIGGYRTFARAVVRLPGLDAGNHPRGQAIMGTAGHPFGSEAEPQLAIGGQLDHSPPGVTHRSFTTGPTQSFVSFRTDGTGRSLKQICRSIPVHLLPCTAAWVMIRYRSAARSDTPWYLLEQRGTGPAIISRDLHQ
jgi:hypothetical protein